MDIPPPNEKQAKLIWFSVTAFALILILVLIGAVLWAAGIVINKISSVLLPLAIAAIIACLLDPLVDFFELRLRVPRTRSILLVFFIALMFILILVSTVVPQLIYESKQLMEALPENAVQLQKRIGDWLIHSPSGIKIKELWDKEYGVKVQEWLTNAVPAISSWLITQLSNVVSWVGLLFGFALVPVYTFYFLLEKKNIRNRWTDYIPFENPKLREESIFIIKSINDCLVAFFRGQIIVSMCTGVMLGLGYTIIGLKYAILLGVIAALLGIIPYLGAIICFVLALTISIIQFQDWLHPLLVVLVYVIAQTIEGWAVSPKIIGDRIGLHPLTIIIALMLGTTLLGGILGGLLAIPITAVLRTLMLRYVWKKPTPVNASQS